MLDVAEQRRIPEKLIVNFDKGCGLLLTEMDELLRLARKYHPEIMVRRGLFRLNDDRRFCIERSNEFTTITTTQNTSGSTGKYETTHNQEIMNFTSEWIHHYFHEACQLAEDELLAERLEELTSDTKATAKTLAFGDSEIEHLLALLSIPKDVGG
jgi:hypothetical protein